ncbi:MAG: hypothetical protein AB7P37_14140, partial [Ramlibacter sp.]
PYPDFTMANPISRDDRRAVSCSGLRPSQLTAPKTYTTPGDITVHRWLQPKAGWPDVLTTITMNVSLKKDAQGNGRLVT